MTRVGYLFFGSLLFGIELMIAISRCSAKKGKPIGVAASLYCGTIVVIISTFFIMGSALITMMAYDFVSLPKYDATIISFESRWEDVEQEDSSGNTYTENVLMHTPTLRFTDDTGQIITENGNVSSGAEPVIGDTVKRAYKDGRLLMLSMTAIGILIGGVFMLVFSYILAEIGSFALGRRPKWVGTLGRHNICARDLWRHVFHDGWLGLWRRL